MREFNLEEAKAGKKVCTRDGRPARVICWDAKLPHGMRIIALNEHDKREWEEWYYSNGRYYKDITIKCADDLMMED